jgi:CRISPR-associated protein Cmr3
MSAAAELHLLVRPVDTLMFRDGRPFNQGDPGAADAVSVFPPFPPTVVGMVRALLAHQLGWDGRSPWDQHIVDALGSGVDWGNVRALGPLTFSAAVVCRANKAGETFEPLYPAPRSILSANDICVRLVPGAAFQTCDLGPARLPVPAQVRDGLKDLGSAWMTSAGLTQVLAGSTPGPDDIVREDDLWEREPRVGVGIDMAGDGSDGLPISKLAERRPVDGALYAATHTRLRENVALAVKVSTSNPQALTLHGVHLGAAGGEHRMAEFDSIAQKDVPRKFPSTPAPLAQLRRENGVVHYAVYHASPCLLTPLPQAGKALDHSFPGTVVSACLGKAQMIGGWDSQGRRPIPMRPAIPAGSVWFMEAPAEVDAEEQILARHRQSIGQAQAWGFGQIFIGTW